MRRLALVVFAISMVMLAGTLVFGTEIKGARRWIVLLGVNIQPSEFVKPAFVILIAWLFGEFDAQAGNAGEYRSASSCCWFGGYPADAAAGFRADNADRVGMGCLCSSWRGCG